MRPAGPVPQNAFIATWCSARFWKTLSWFIFHFPSSFPTVHSRSPGPLWVRSCPPCLVPCGGDVHLHHLRHSSLRSCSLEQGCLVYYDSAWADITKYHSSWLTPRNSFSCVSEARIPESRCWWDWFSQGLFPRWFMSFISFSWVASV